MPPRPRDQHADAFTVDDGGGPTATSPSHSFENEATPLCESDEAAHPPPTVIQPRKSFITEFSKTNGAPQILLLMVILAFGFGSTVGVVPAVMMDRFARINHGFVDAKNCSRYALDKPKECLAGSADSQNAAAWEQLVSNILCFFLNTLVGSISDQYGRKAILIPGLFVASLQPLCLVLLQLQHHMNPLWYYAAGSATGIIGWVSVTLSALSDVVPPEWRAASFGMLLAALSLGFALSPTLALFLGHFQISVLSLSSIWLGLFLVIFALPETLSPNAAQEARHTRRQLFNELSETERSVWLLYRPLWELSILNRSRLFRLISCLAFFSGMVSSADRTLLIYFLQERLAFDERDVATMFMIIGLLGILIQGVLLKFINDFIGEKRVVVLSFVLGIVTNLIYGLAKNKSTIFIGIVIGTFSGMSFPTISAIKSNNVAECEQGRIQGALYSLSALASGIGPVILRVVYHFTRNGAFFGPGSMFVVAAMLYLVAVYCGLELPPEACSNNRIRPNDETEDDAPMSETSAPLLP